MPPHLTLILTLALLLVPHAGIAQDTRETRSARSIEGSTHSLFSERAYRAHLEFLADDLCEGRAPGTRGGDLAALYLATRFREAGLHPITEEGGYEQQVPMVGNLTDQESVRFALMAGKTVRYFIPGEEVVLSSERPGEQIDVSGGLLFVGYGIEAPEYEWNDYKGQDVAGAILVMLVNDPPFESTGFGSESLTYYGRWTYKHEIARKKGAAGVILIHTDQSAGYGFEVVRSSHTVEQVALEGARERPLTIRGWVTRPAIDEILAEVDLDYERLKQKADRSDFRPIPLGLELEASLRQQRRRFSSPNVVGVLPGSDPAGEAVLFLAHYDHLGIGPGSGGDRIHNGAIDNASGTAALICLARAFAEAPTPPRRSLVFLATTGEEKGLLGSEHYARNPVVPLEKTVIALNKDCCNFRGRHAGFRVFPVRYTDATPAFETLGEEMGLTFGFGGPDRGGGAFRTDSFPLSARGVVALSLGLSGENLTLTKEEVKAMRERAGRWYHQPTDEIRPDFRYEGVLQELEILYRCGRHWADGAPAPRLLPGHPFETAGRMRRQ